MSTTAPVPASAKMPRGSNAAPPRSPRAPRRSRSATAVDVTPEAMRARLATVELELLERYPNADMVPVESAFEFAAQAHAGQMRASGEPYVTHPLAVAGILAELGLDPVAVQAALLHDIPEDTEHTIDDLEERFG